MKLDSVKEHYWKKFKEHGPSPQGMDWKNDDAQNSRFLALAELIEPYASVNDWGCGDGKFAAFFEGPYTGYDINPHKLPSGEFILSDRPTHVADYTVASGLFNVKLDKSFLEWVLYFRECIEIMNQKSKKGFAFNVLSSYSDIQDPDLFYASPIHTFDMCRKYSPFVALDHSYSKYDFTVRVKK